MSPIIRIAKPSDISFIYSTWLNSYKYGSNIGHSVIPSIFFNNYRNVIDHILEKAETVIYIACLDIDENVILGYIVSEPDILHYCYVKDAFRRLGIATTLYNKSFTGSSIPNITHQTSYRQYINKSFTYNPFLLYQGVK